MWNENDNPIQPAYKDDANPVTLHHKLSRRKLLLSLGATGAAAFLLNNTMLAAQDDNRQTLMETVYGPGGGKSNGSLHSSKCRMTTIAQLRTISTPDANTIYFVTDSGKEGGSYTIRRIRLRRIIRAR